MSWSSTLRRRVRRRGRMLFEYGLDLVVLSLVGRESVHRLADDIVRHLIANPLVQDLVDEIVSYISVQPAVRELVHEQGANLTDQAIDQARQHLVEADVVVNRVVAGARKRLHLGRRRDTSQLRST